MKIAYLSYYLQYNVIIMIIITMIILIIIKIVLFFGFLYLTLLFFQFSLFIPDKNGSQCIYYFEVEDKETK